MIQENSAFEAIRALLNHTSVAVIGASSDTTKFSGMIVPHLIEAGFQGKIYPVNPRRTEILGLRCYPSVKEIPGVVDLACIITPPGVVPSVVKESAEKGVKIALIITAGFGEAGAEGKKIQSEIVKVARKGGMRICGPNSEGVILLVTNTWVALFSGVKPVLGEVAVVTQSGGIGEFALFHMWERGLGASHWISSGNEADLEISDYVEYLVQDPHTKVISLFIEGVRDGERFKKAVEMAAKARKPVIALKVGRSEKATLTAKSHTGALTGSDEVYDAVFKQLGIIRALKLEELFEIPMALAWQPLPKSNKVGVITDSGGMACLIADALEEAGLRLPDFTNETLKKLGELLPPEATAKNPLDLTAAVTPEEHAENVAKCVDIIAGDDQVDALIAVITWWPAATIAQISENLIKKAKRVRELDKPLLVCLTAVTTPIFLELAETFAKNKIPLYTTPEKTVTAMKAMVNYRKFLRKNSE
jgi:acyl-CoA synthetase (NDP forming)